MVSFLLLNWTILYTDHVIIIAVIGMPCILLLCRKWDTLRMLICSTKLHIPHSKDIFPSSATFHKKILNKTCLSFIFIHGWAGLICISLNLSWRYYTHTSFFCQLESLNCQIVDEDGKGDKSGYGIIKKKVGDSYMAYMCFSFPLSVKSKPCVCEYESFPKCI